MQRFRLSFALLLVAGLAAAAGGCRDSTASADRASDQGQAAVSAATVWTMTVEGMSCAVNCAPTVEKALRSLPGVRSATVDFETKTARVETEAGVELDTAAIDKSFDNQGYFVENLERLPAP